jgi:NADH:ubiquinone reductase (H+-translocating)
MESDVLVLGGGFAGFWAALAAKATARALGSDALRVTLVSREPVLQLRPRLYEAQPETLGVPLQPLLQRAGVAWLQGEVVGLDVGAGRVALADGRSLGGHSLVVTTGSRMRRPEFAGAELAFSIDTQPEAIALDRRLAELACTVAEPHIAIVGAGFTGIELALEMRDRLALHGGPGPADRAQIVLIDGSADPGQRIGRAAWAVVVEALAQARVQLRLGMRVQRLQADALFLDDGARFPAHLAVLATGLEAAPAASWVPGNHDESGRIVVDCFLRAPAANRADSDGQAGGAGASGGFGLWAAGDAASADDGSGHATVASCQHALQSGRFAGANAARALLRAPPLRFQARPYVTCIDLGRYGALFTQGRHREVLRHGPEAKATKQRINRVVIHPPQEAMGEELLALALPVQSVEGNAASVEPAAATSTAPA